MGLPGFRDAKNGFLYKIEKMDRGMFSYGFDLGFSEWEPDIEIRYWERFEARRPTFAFPLSSGSRGVRGYDA